MKIQDIKKQMLEYEDFYGGDFPESDLIKKAKTKKELAAIIDRHDSRLDDMLADAKSHLTNFKRKIGLEYK